MKNRTAVILGIILFIFAIAGGVWGFLFYEKQQTETFKASAVQLYNSYKIIVDDGNALIKNVEGRQFDNIFSELNELKKRNQELRMKLTEMAPKSEESKRLHQQLKSTLDAHSEFLKSTLSIAEKQKSYQAESFNKNSEKFKNLEASFDAALEKHNTIAKKSREERKKLQAMLGLAIDPDEPDDNASSKEVNSTKQITNTQVLQKTNSATNDDAVTVTYYYGPNNVVTFTQNNIVLRVGQKLILKRDPTSPENLKLTRFMSNGESFAICQLVEMINKEGDQRGAKHDGAIFLAKKPGEGKLQVVPNYGDWNNAGYLFATVKP